MDYTINKKTDLSFNEAIKKVGEELKKEGFGIITEIDLKEKFREKLNVDFRNYKILGACNPEIAYKAIQLEDKIGAMLPCNVVVQENNGEVEISAINPLTSIGALDNSKLKDLASEVSKKLKVVIERV